jgi:hypothetical protein
LNQRSAVSFQLSANARSSQKRQKQPELASDGIMRACDKLPHGACDKLCATNCRTCSLRAASDLKLMAES